MNGAGVLWLNADTPAEQRSIDSGADQRLLSAHDLPFDIRLELAIEIAGGIEPIRRVPCKRAQAHGIQAVRIPLVRKEGRRRTRYPDARWTVSRRRGRCASIWFSRTHGPICAGTRCGGIENIAGSGEGSNPGQRQELMDRGAADAKRRTAYRRRQRPVPTLSECQVPAVPATGTEHSRTALRIVTGTPREPH